MNPAPPAGGGSHVGQSGRPMSPSPPAGGGSHVGQSVVCEISSSPSKDLFSDVVLTANGCGTV
ncbi:hypothetical protein FRB91_008658 [Serendipita sp. 411]|nr:hypothetical protein FRB91_008658 [Serendipita sp. 411]